MKLTEEQIATLTQQVQQLENQLKDYVEAANREIAHTQGRIAALKELLNNTPQEGE